MEFWNKLLTLKQEFGGCPHWPTSGDFATGAVNLPRQPMQFLKLVSPAIYRASTFYLTTDIPHSFPFNFPVTQCAAQFQPPKPPLIG